MKKLSFIITILGIFILLIFLSFQNPIPINSLDELSNFKVNQKIITQGFVIEEKSFKHFKTLSLDNGLLLSCKLPCPSYINKNINAIGLLETYSGELIIKILEIKIIS